MTSRWQELAGHDAGADYAARMDAHVAGNDDVHGEADLVATLAPSGGRILDAGCGTGRVAIELARRGFDVVGTDLDPSMLAIARDRRPAVAWHLDDLATLDLPAELAVDGFDVVVAAGNVVPLLAAGTEAATINRLAAHLRGGGRLVVGFGLDAAHLPLDEPPVTIADHDRWCAAAGLEPVDRWATWDRDPFDDSGYVVAVHRRPLIPTGGRDRGPDHQRAR